MNSTLPNIELLEKLKQNNNFIVTENLESNMYSLIILYKGNVVCSRGTFRKPHCHKYLNKRLKYVSDLEQHLQDLNIEF